MGIVELRRKNTQFSISQNPATIVIHRKGERRANGGIERLDAKLPPQTVRIYNTGGSPQQVITLAGEKQTDRHYNMLADYLADIQASTEVKDEFVHGGVKYQVKAVWPQTIQGQLVGYQCELERVM